MTRSPAPQARPAVRMKGPERRHQIATTARSAFAENGYQRTTTGEVARRAGLSEALVLKHFGSKEQLFREAVVDPLLAILDAIRDENLVRVAEGRRSSPADDMRRLEEHLNELATFVRENVGLLVAMLAEARLFPEAGARMTALLEAHVQDLSASAGQLTATGQYRAFNPRLFTYISLAAAAVAALGTEQPDEAIGEVVDVLFFGLLSSPGRTAARRRKRGDRG